METIILPRVIILERATFSLFNQCIAVIKSSIYINSRLLSFQDFVT